MKQFSTTLLLLSFLLNLVFGSRKNLNFTTNVTKLEDGKECDLIGNYEFCSRSRVEYIENEDVTTEDFYTLEEREVIKVIKEIEGSSIVSTTPPENHFFPSAPGSDIMKTRRRLKSFDIPSDEILILSNDHVPFYLNSENLKKYEFNEEDDDSYLIHRNDSCSTENEEWEGLDFNCDSNDSYDLSLELEMEKEKSNSEQFKKLQSNFNFYGKSRMNKRPSKLFLLIDSISEDEKENEEDE